MCVCVCVQLLFSWFMSTSNPPSPRPPPQGPEQCAECVHLQDGGVCVPRCPSGVKEEQGTVWKYSNASGHCLSCNTNCTLS